MGKTSDMIAAAKLLKAALESFVDPSERMNILVFQSSPGNLRAFVGTNKFKGKGPAQRQNEIWTFLKNKVASDQLQHCIGVHTLDAGEYEEATFPSAAALEESDH